MWTKNVYIFILLNILAFNHAVPQKYYQGPAVNILVEDNKPILEAENSWKSEIDSKIEALEKLTENLKNKLEQLEGCHCATEFELTSAPPRRVKEVGSDYLVNLSNVTVKLYSNDLRIVSELNEGNSVSSKSHCIFDIDKVSEHQPLMVSPSLTWPSFEVNELGKMVIPNGKEFVLICPNKFINFPEKYVTATCNGGTRVLVNGVQHEYSDIQCTEKVKHIVERTGQKCLPGNSEKVKISYKLLNTETIELYEICVEKTYNDAIYTKHYMHNSIADVDYSTGWSDSNQFKMDFDDAFNCTLQTDYISRRLGEDFHTQDRCCFAKRQLVSHRDVFPGVTQRAAFSYVNVAPQWSTCNAENWNEVEFRVRAFAKASRNSLLVWTGVKYDDLRRIAFMGKGYAQFAPIYFWKVVQDTASSSSLAIIQVNVPDLTIENKHLYTPCTDICDQIEWMRGFNWSDVNQGYTYCCSIKDFEREFDFHNVFEPHHSAVLTGVY